MERLKRRGQLSEVPNVTSRIAELRNALLSENDLFRGIGETEMTQIGERLPMATADRGSLIYTPGETPDALFLLKSGNVRIYRLAEDGRKLVLATVGPGTAFGEMSLLGQSMTGSFAEAIDDCTVCVMSTVDVEQLMEEHPAVAVRLVQLMSSRLRQAEDQLEQLAFRSVPARLGKLLLTLADDSGEVSGHSHQELADMIGTSRETVSRALVELKAEGLVSIERRCVRLLNREALESHVEVLDG
jgi:CRP/FNR family transcriptional regulator, cyclic AMP receptor protein